MTLSASPDMTGSPDICLDRESDGDYVRRQRRGGRGSQSDGPGEVTAAVTRNFTKGNASVCIMAERAGAPGGACGCGSGGQSGGLRPQVPPAFLQDHGGHEKSGQGRGHDGGGSQSGYSGGNRPGETAEGAGLPDYRHGRDGHRQHHHQQRGGRRPSGKEGGGRSARL